MKQEIISPTWVIFIMAIMKCTYKEAEDRIRAESVLSKIGGTAEDF